MITVVETSHYLQKAKKVLSRVAAEDVISLLAANPLMGDLLEAGSGIRKVRIVLDGRGKSGGARVIYYYHNETIPLFLLTVFAKNEKDNLSGAELKIMARAAELIRETYRS